MGLEVRRILARANGSFQSRKTKKSTLGMSSRRSQYRTLAAAQKWAHWPVPAACAPQRAQQAHATQLSHPCADSTLTWSCQCPHTAEAGNGVAH